MLKFREFERALIDEALQTARNAAGRVTAAASSLVYQPGAVNPAFPVFNDWNVLYAFIAASPDVARIVTIDDSITTPARIPAGTYDLANIILSGDLEEGKTVDCQLDDGVVFTNLGEVTNKLRITSNNTVTPVHTATDGGDIILIVKGAVIASAPGTVPFFHIPAGLTSAPTYASYFGGEFGDVAGRRIFDLAAGAQIQVILDFFASLKNDIAQGGAGAAFNVIVSSQSAYANTSNPVLQPGVPGFPGAINFFFANLTNATDSPPAYGSTLVQGQLDEAKRCLTSFTGSSLAVGPSGGATVVTLPAIDVNANESLVIDACATFTKDATPGDVTVAIDIDAVPVDNTGSLTFGANETGTISRTVQVKPAVGNRVVTLAFTSVAGQASVAANGARVVVRRVLA